MLEKIKNILLGVSLSFAIFAALFTIGMFPPALAEAIAGYPGRIAGRILIQIPVSFYLYKLVKKSGTRIRQEPLRLGLPKTAGIILIFAALCCVPIQYLYRMRPYDSTPPDYISVLLIAPIAEELGFRGAIFGKARKHLGFLPATIISSTLFQMAHGHIVHAFLTVPVAVCCCAAYEATGSLLLPIALHVTYNLVSALMDGVITMPVIMPIIAVAFYFIAMLIVIPMAFRIGVKAASETKRRVEA